MSALWDKIQTYTNYAGWELANGVSTTPPKIGTDNTTMASAPVYLGNSIIGTTLKNVADSPPGGAGNCWAYTGALTANASNYAYAEWPLDHFNVVTDTTHKTNYVLGFWFKIIVGNETNSTLTLVNLDPYPTSGVTISLMNNSIRKLWVRNKYNEGSGIQNIGRNPAQDAFLLDVWYYVAYYRTGSDWKVFVDGVEVISQGGLDATNSQNIAYMNTFPIRAFGSTSINSTGKQVRLSSIHYSANSTIAGGISQAALAEIYTAGTTVSSIDDSYQAEVMTATNANFPEPTIAITTGVSFLAQPLTANAELLPILTSGTANTEQTFFIATAILTQPTLSFTFNDNTEIVTFFQGSCLFVNPASVQAQIQITNLATPIIANAVMTAVTVTGSSSVSFTAVSFVASCLFVQPTRVGPDDLAFLATPMNSTSLMTVATIAIPTNYRHLVKKHLPLFYGIQNETPNWRFMQNDGYSTFTTINNSNSAASKDVASPFEFASIGNQHSWKVDTAVSNSLNRFTWTHENPGLEDMKAAWISKNWTLEFWVIPGVTSVDPPSTFEINLASVLTVQMIRGAEANPSTGSIIERYNAVSIYLNDTVDADIKHKLVRYFTQLNIIRPKPMDGLSASGWNHIVITSSGDANTNIITTYINGFILDSTSVNFPITPQYSDTITGVGNYFRIQPPYNENAHLDEPVFYNKTLTSNEVYEHYNFVKTFNPNSFNFPIELEAYAEMGDHQFFIVANLAFPATPITANALFVNPVIGTSRTIVAPLLSASILFVNPFFYGDPDFNNLTLPMTASADVLPNIFRLDTAYYTYVQTNIAPLRFVTFDSPNSYLDHGSDNDFGNASPFVTSGTITNPIFGLNNNSLLTNATNYLTDGLIMKESEHSDNWGSVSGIYHFSLWMQKSTLDTNPLGLRIVANVNSYLDNQYVLLYQYGDYLYLQVNDKTNAVVNVASSSVVNVFDGNKKHIVLVASHPGSNGNIKVYVNGLLKINANIGDVHPKFINSNSYYFPNSETYNEERFSVGSLITPLEETYLPINPTASQIYIDDVHWAITSLNQTQVTNLNNAMPYSLDMTFNADVALATNANFVQPTVGLSSTITATPLTCNALLVNPVLQLVFNNIVNVLKMQASSLFVLPYYFADNINNINVLAQPLPAQAVFVDPGAVVITFAFPTMTATVTMQFQKPYLDPYNLLILQQSVMTPVGNLYNRLIGDIDT